MEAQIRAAALENYFDVARQLKLETLPILQTAGLTRAMFQDPDRRIPAYSAMALLDEAARVSECQTFSLRMAETRKLADLGAIGLVLAHQASLRDALDTLVRYRRLMNESLAMLVEEVGKTVIVRAEVVLDKAPASRQANELAIGTLHQACKLILGERWQPLSVNFTHGAPHDLCLHRQVFRCQLKFHSDFNGIVCATSDLDHRSPDADPMMAEHARRFLEHRLPEASAASSVLEVRQAIYLLLPMGCASIERVAQKLDLNVRTLQRQLKAVGTVYTDLVNEVRCELAMRYLANPHFPLAHTAALLGFSMPSSFTRWFSIWFGVSPSHWREHEAPGATR